MSDGFHVHGAIDRVINKMSSQSQQASTSRQSAGQAAARYEAILKDEERYQDKQYPTTEDVPGCMRLFDEFLMCYALVPQLRNLYRHGEPRDCGWKFQDFKYCMALKSDSPDLKRQLWVKRKAEWWAGRRVVGSSEDVWDMRQEPLENFPPLQAEADVQETMP